MDVKIVCGLIIMELAKTTDRAFQFAPEIFKQLYTLNVQYKCVNLSLFYALLPNKKRNNL